MRVQTGRPWKISWFLEDQDGNPVDASPDPTAVVTRVRDATVLSSVTVAHVTGRTGEYTISGPAQSAAELLTAVVTAAAPYGTVTDTVPISVVGSRLVNLARLKQDTELASLSADALREALEATEDECKDNLGYPPCPILEEVFIDSGGRSLICPNPYPRYLVAATRPNGVALTAPELALTALGEGGGIVWSDMRNWDRGVWSVWLVHGRWDVPPMDLTRAALIRTRDLARRLNNRDAMSERASTVATEGGTLTFSFPTLPRPTGLPEVDIVYMRYALGSQLPVKV